MRPVWSVAAFFWNFRQFAFQFGPGLLAGVPYISIVRPGIGMNEAGTCGPVILKLVASWTMPAAFFTWTAAVLPGSGWLMMWSGTVTGAPTPAPVVTTFLPPTKPAHW